MSDFIVRPARSLEEVSRLWWPLMKELEWNRDPADANTHFRVARDGKDWLLLVSKEADKPEGCVVAFTFPNSTGWVGFFCVNERIRGNGHGRALWKNLEEVYRGSGTSMIGLDGVKQQVETYERRGFKDCGLVHLMIRPSVQEKGICKELNTTISVGTQLLDLKDVQAELLADYDLAHTGLDRRALWPALLARDDVYGYTLQSTSNESTTLLGYVLVRHCEHGHRFGPLYAESYDHASLLLIKAMEHISKSSGSMVAEIFGSNPRGRQLFEEHGWVWGNLDYHRMWLNGKLPKEQAEGGKGTMGMYATFDAAEG